MADLAVLRTAKVAMDEELITQEDFNEIKTAFLRAQQIKAGLDAGFIREEDYVQARDSFLHALDFSTGVAQVAASGSQRPTPPGQQAPSGSRAGPMPTGHPLPAPATASRPAPLPLTRSMPPPPPPPVHGAAGIMAAAALSATTSQVQLTSAGTSADHSEYHPGPFESRPGTVPIPEDLPRIGRAGLAVGKRSMSGIGLHDSCINIFNHIKTKSSYKWVSFKVDDAGTQVVLDQLGSNTSTYDQFVAAALPDSQCRFAVYDYAYHNADTGQTNQKMVFVHWAPESSPTKQKMMYASTKEFLKGFLDGLGAELQADTMSEMAEDNLRERVGYNMTRK